MRPAGRQSLRVSRAPECRACLASDTRHKRNRRGPRPTPYMHEHPAQAVRSHTTRQTTPAQPASGARRSLVFVYRQEVFELSIYVASSIAHAHEESNRGLAISHKHTTWAKVDFHDARRCSTRKRAGNAAIELPGIHSTRTPIRQRNPVSRQQISRSWDKKCRFRGVRGSAIARFRGSDSPTRRLPPLRRNYLKVDPP